MWLQGKASLSVVEMKNGVLFSIVLPFVTSSSSHGRRRAHVGGSRKWLVYAARVHHLFSFFIDCGPWDSATHPPTPGYPFLFILSRQALRSVINPVKLAMKTNHSEEGFRQDAGLIRHLKSQRWAGRVRACTW